MVAFVSSCASSSYNPRIEFLGEYDASASKKVEEQANEMKWAQAEEVKVYIGKGPEGLEISEEGEITDFNEQYQNFGKVYVNQSGFNNFMAFGSYPEDEDWRNSYCPVQTVMFYGTLGLWGLTPFPWFCVTVETNDTEDVNARKERIINTLKKVVKAAGGDTLFITALGKTETVSKNTNKVINTLDMTSAEGYALRKR